MGRAPNHKTGCFDSISHLDNDPKIEDYFGKMLLFTGTRKVIPPPYYYAVLSVSKGLDDSLDM